MKFTFMSRFAIKFIEVAGAGIASALCAYFLGQIERGPVAGNRGRPDLARDD